MRSFVACAYVAGLITSVSDAMKFINPPTMAQLGKFANAQSYKEGSSVIVVWTAGKKGLGASLALYQQKMTTGEWYGTMEYLTQNAVDATQYNWLVGSRKNLTESNLFYLSIFQEGTGPSDDNSDYFYIVPKEAAVASPSATSSKASTTSSSISISVTSNPPSLQPSSKSSSTPSSPPSSPSTPSSFPTAAKIGVGVGIPIALILGLAAGFLLFRRCKKNTAAATAAAAATSSHDTTYYHHGQSEYRYQDNTPSQYYAVEAPPKSPVEMNGGHARLEPSRGYLGPVKMYHDDTAVRYEM